MIKDGTRTTKVEQLLDSIRLAWVQCSEEEDGEKCQRLKLEIATYADELKKVVLEGEGNAPRP